MTPYCPDNRKKTDVLLDNRIKTDMLLDNKKTKRASEE